MPNPIAFKGYEDVGRIATWAASCSHYIDEARDGLIYWVSEYQGGVLSRKLAKEISAYIRAKVADQSAFSGTPPLSRSWREVKQRYGLDERKGIATGSLMDAIEFHRAGKTKGYRVGISSKARASKFIVNREGRKVKIGSATQIQEYAAYLEFGTRTQPARPWFYPSFDEYMQTRFPEVISDTLKKDFESNMKKFAYLCGDYWRDVSPNEYYTKYGRVK